jgi:hypothetical protein
MEANGIGETLFSNRSSANLLSQELFEANVFKGINLRPSNPDADAYTISFAPASSSSLNFSFRVYFSLPEDTISRIQTFFIGTSFYHADADFSNTKYLSGLEAGGGISTDMTGNECYIQSGVGLTTKITFPGLVDFAAQNPSIAINKAELTFDPIEGSQEAHGRPPEVLSFFVLDEDGDYDENILLLQEGRSPDPVSTVIVQNTPVLTLQYGQNSGTYPTADITSYIQDVFRGNLPNNGILINPFLRRGSVSRCIFGDNENSQSKLKLRLYYSENASRD